MIEIVHMSHPLVIIDYDTQEITENGMDLHNLTVIYSADTEGNEKTLGYIMELGHCNSKGLSYT